MCVRVKCWVEGQSDWRTGGCSKFIRFANGFVKKWYLGKRENDPNAWTIDLRITSIRFRQYHFVR